MTNPTKTERNLDMMRDRVNGMSYRQLAIKYSVTFSRCRQIVGALPNVKTKHSRDYLTLVDRATTLQWIKLHSGN